MRVMAGTSMGASDGLPFSTLWSTTMPSTLFGHLCLVPELHRLAQSALADGTGIGVVEGDQPGGAIGDLAGKSDAGLADDLVEGGDRGLELGHQRGGLARRRVAGTAKSSPGIYGHDLGVFDGGLGDRSQLAGQAEHFVFGIAASSPRPGGNLMSTTAHRTGAVPKPGPTGQARCLDRIHGLGQLDERASHGTFSNVLFQVEVASRLMIP
jgi:hypothetical protein